MKTSFVEKVRSAASRSAPFRSVMLALSCWSFLALFQLLGLFEILDLKLSDLRFQIRGARQASNRIALVEEDDATIRRFGRSVPREYYGYLIAALEEGGARAIALDFLFRGNDIRDPRADTLLADVSVGRDELVFAVAFLPPNDPGAQDRAEDRTSLQAMRRHAVVRKGRRLPRAGAVRLPYPALAKTASSLGHVSLPIDRDGMVRRLPLFIEYEGRAYPALSTSLVNLSRQPVEGARPLTILALPAVNHIWWADGVRNRVPVDSQGFALIDFVGGQESFPNRYSMLNVLRWYDKEDFSRLRAAFAGRLVLVGNTAMGEGAADVGATPFAALTPLVYLHANAVDALLRDGFLVPIPPWLVLAILALWTAVLGWSIAGISVPRAAILVVCSTVLWALLGYALFEGARWNIPMFLGLIIGPAIYGLVESHRILFAERRERERNREIAIARDIQLRLLPANSPAISLLEVFGTNLPAQEVGGDYYDWIPLGNDRLAVAVGDVSGKGISAALLMAHLHASLHAESRLHSSPSAILDAMHGSLYRALEARRFATFFLAWLDPKEQRLRYANAGHNPGFLIQNGSIMALPATGLPLGMIEDAPPYTDCHHPFLPGSTLVLYSDGITECAGTEGLYGEERLVAVLKSHAQADISASQLGTEILSNVTRFARDGLRSDDVTLLVVTAVDLRRR